MLRARQSLGRGASQTRRAGTWSLSRLQSHPDLQREGWEQTHGGLWVSEHDLIPQTRGAAPGLDQGTAAAGAPEQEGRENPPEHLPLALHNSPWPKTTPFPAFQLHSGGFLGALLEDHEDVVLVQEKSMRSRSPAFGSRQGGRELTDIIWSPAAPRHDHSW